MLHTESIESGTLEALRRLMCDDIREREPILTLRGSYDWALIDARLRSMLDNMERIYEAYPFAFD